jgi:hypothetical protein
LILYTDASQYAQPAVENEEDILPGISSERPIYFLSHNLSKSQRKWSTIEKMAYAIYYTIQKLKFYLEKTEFVVRTNHKPLIMFMSKEIQNRKVQNWALNLQNFNFTVEHIPGKENTCVDLLSRITQEKVESDDQIEKNYMEIDDRNLQVNIINSNRVPETRETQQEDTQGGELEEEEEREVREGQIQYGAITIEEQEKDEDLGKIRKVVIKKGNVKKLRKYIIDAQDKLLCSMGMMYFQI